MKTIEHICGDTWKRAWVVGGDTPVDISGSSARLHVRDETNTELIKAYDSASLGGLTITGDAGRIDLRAEASDMVLKEGKYLFEVELKLSDNTVITLETGKMKIIKDVARD